MSLEQKKELHELNFKEINVYLQENLKVNLLEEEWKEIISPEAFIQKEMYMVDRVKKRLSV